MDLPPRLVQCSRLQRLAEGLRFRLWELAAEFDRILYLDADMLVVGPVEQLFLAPLGVFFAATINGTRWAFSTGLPLQSEWDLSIYGADDNLGAYGRLRFGSSERAK